MAQMSFIRQKLGGYKLIDIENYYDCSWMTPYEIEHMQGMKYSYFRYMNKRSRVVQKTVKGHWDLTKGQEQG